VWLYGLVEIALQTARHNCPGCRVVHLHCVNSSVGWDDSFDVGKSLGEAFEFLDSFPEEKFGPNDPAFHKGNIARWKMIADWMEENGVEEAACCDSDVLLFNNPFKTPHYQPGKLHVSDNHTGCVHAGHPIISIEHAKKVWEDAGVVLNDPDTINETVGDMVPWTRLAFKDGFVDQNQIIDGVAWDHHMGCVKDEGGWEEDPEFPGYKRIQWIDQKPHCLHVPSGELVRLVNLHCWGDAEANMPEYAKLGGVCL
jgi:hypothetical protein